MVALVRIGRFRRDDFHGDYAQRPSGMTCARHPVGALPPASSTPTRSPASGQAPPRGHSRPDPSPGRRRARLFRLLPALALLLGALSLLPTSPAQAQVPGAPTAVTTTSGDTKLEMTWTAPSEPVITYDVHYTLGSFDVNGAVQSGVFANPAFLRDLLAASEAGGGYVEYMFDNPAVQGDEETGSPKIAYATGFRMPNRNQVLVVASVIYPDPGTPDQ